MNAPRYWMHETSGVLRPAVQAYLQGDELTGDQVATLRAYLRQWINAPDWKGRQIHLLRMDIDELTDRDAIGQWLARAAEIGIDPL